MTYEHFLSIHCWLSGQGLSIWGKYFSPKAISYLSSTCINSIVRQGCQDHFGSGRRRWFLIIWLIFLGFLWVFFIFQQFLVKFYGFFQWYFWISCEPFLKFPEISHRSSISQDCWIRVKCQGDLRQGDLLREAPLRKYSGSFGHSTFFFGGGS